MIQIPMVVWKSAVNRELEIYQMGMPVVLKEEDHQVAVQPHSHSTIQKHMPVVLMGSYTQEIPVVA